MKGFYALQAEYHFILALYLVVDCFNVIFRASRNDRIQILLQPLSSKRWRTLRPKSSKECPKVAEWNASLDLDVEKEVSCLNEMLLRKSFELGTNLLGGTE